MLKNYRLVTFRAMAQRWKKERETMLLQFDVTRQISNFEELPEPLIELLSNITRLLLDSI